MSVNEKNKIQSDRSKVIIRTSLINILANVVLSVIKAIVGLTVNSIAVVLDAVNNLSDALSSLVTIIGTKLAGKAPDQKHPFGYGRIEYMSSILVAAIVLYAGITSITESIRKIIHPVAADYGTVSLVIISLAIIVKIILGRYVKLKGKKINSVSLVAAGSEASFDAILSASVLVSAIIYIFYHISLEAYVGVIISIFIIRAGLEMIKESVDEVLGNRVSKELSKAIKETINKDPDVHGVYDLVLNNYGPNRFLGSVHVDVIDTMTADKIDMMMRRIQYDVYKEHSVILTGVGIYSINTKNDETADIRTTIMETVMSHEGVLQFHGFYVDMEKHTMTFDIIIDFAIKERHEIYKNILDAVKKNYPEYQIYITLDDDVSD